MERSELSHYHQHFSESTPSENVREVRRENTAAGTISDRELDDYLNRLWELDAHEASTAGHNLGICNTGASVASSANVRESLSDGNREDMQSRRQKRRLTIASQFSSSLETIDETNTSTEGPLSRRNNYHFFD